MQPATIRQLIMRKDSQNGRRHYWELHFYELSSRLQIPEWPLIYASRSCANSNSNSNSKSHWRSININYYCIAFAARRDFDLWGTIKSAFRFKLAGKWKSQVRSEYENQNDMGKRGEKYEWCVRGIK